MISTRLRRVTTGLLALMVLVLAACAGGDDNGGSGGGAPTTGTLSGQVLASADSAAVADATVSVGSRSTQTAADGRFTLTEVPAAARAVLRVSASGYVDALVATPVTAGQTVQANARLLREAAAQGVDAASAAVVQAAGSVARVELPAASLVNAATGAAVSGTVTVSVTPIDPARDPATMPGDYTVSDTQRIESFGAIKVKLRDAAGNALNLKSGATATIRIPVATRGGTPPASIPLYWFNEATGRWVQDGSATLAGTAPNRYYEGQVSHFTYWNADMPQDTIYVNGCVADAGGKRVSGALVSSSGIDYSGTANTLSGSDGAFRVAIRQGGRASVWAELNAGSNTVVVGPSQVDITLPDCLVLSSAATAPQVVQPPVSAQVDAGSLAVFSVVASGTRPLSYQWQRDGVNIAGATYEWLLINPVSASDAGRYTVVVRNAAGSATSAAAVLSVVVPVQAAPAITLQPLDATAEPGSTVTFGVAASGNPAPSYQWRRNGTAISGATAASYTTPALSSSDSGAVYSVVVSNSQGTATSRDATLTVSASASDTDAKTQLMRLLSLSFDFYEAASTPLLLTDDNAAAFVSAAGVCSSGSISGQLNGGALPAAGTAMPPAATLSATASACDVGGTVHTGSASVSYNLSSLAPPMGSATGSVTAMRLTDRSGGTVSRDITANGTGSLSMTGSVSGATTSQTVTLAPASGATLRNELSGLTATFASGNVAFTSDTVATSALPTRTRVSYNDLRFAVAGVSYLASGYYELTFGSQGVPGGGSGEVVLSAGGVTVGRIYANANGVFIDVNGISQPFAARRANAR